MYAAVSTLLTDIDAARRRVAEHRLAVSPGAAA
jgi:hypothetical protein